MGLKKSVVIRNEYTIKGKDGGGSRGGTPGDYVLRYMARKGATEGVTPIRKDVEDYVRRYMARDDATEPLTEASAVVPALKELDGLGGRAFGHGCGISCASLSDRQVRDLGQDIQECFDSGKTVMKTILSFHEDYLKECGAVPEDFHCERRGDYRGMLDQMRLRLAIMNGLKLMSKDYDDLEYVGAIQVDTKHVHCHLAMVDRGKGNLAPDGTQRGKIPEHSKRLLRHGLDMSLRKDSKVRMMASNVTMDRRNALMFVKRCTHRTLENRGFAQFLVACLPADRRLWRASTNDRRMQKANALVREYVEQALSQPQSGFREAMMDVDKYARERTKRDDLSGREYRMYLNNGRERIIRACMDGVYSVVRMIPESELSVRTDFLDVMSAEYDDLKKAKLTEPMIEFGYRLRSYSARLEHHEEQVRVYRDAIQAYHGSPDPHPDSAAMLRFFEEEEEYHGKLVSKYRHFLGFLPPSEAYREEFKRLQSEEQYLRMLDKMQGDASLKRMSGERAEEYGREVYGVSGGRFVKESPGILAARLEQGLVSHGEGMRIFRQRLSDEGLGIDYGTGGLVWRDAYPFDDVKALDMHHLYYDFDSDFEVTMDNVLRFREAARSRKSAYDGAREYLERTGQGDLVPQLPSADVDEMWGLAQRMDPSSVTVYHSRRDMLFRHADGRTVSLDKDLDEDLKAAIRRSVEMSVR